MAVFVLECVSTISIWQAKEMTSISQILNFLLRDIFLLTDSFDCAVRHKVGAQQMGIVHLPNYWKLVDSQGESEYAMIAQLISVCWLEITAKFYNVLPGSYDAVWRIEFPTESSTDTQIDWTVAPVEQDAKTPLVEPVKFSHGKRADWTRPLINKGWFEVFIGRIEIPSSFGISPIVSARIFGGNHFWFRDLRIDYAALRPVNRDDPIPPIPSIKLEDNASLIRAWRDHRADMNNLPDLEDDIDENGMEE